MGVVLCLRGKTNGSGKMREGNKGLPFLNENLLIFLFCFHNIYIFHNEGLKKRGKRGKNVEQN